MGEIVPVLGVLTGMIIPLGVFVWLYLSDKNKNETILEMAKQIDDPEEIKELIRTCLLYTSPSPRDLSTSRMPSSA